jgi:septum formation protein
MAKCRMPNAECRMPNAECRMPNAESELVLASASPRRAELLTLAGFRFVVDPADVDETERPGEKPDDYVLRVARDKARTVAQRQAGRVVLAADTTVVADGRILAKPADEADAIRMLELLSGGVHDVWTGVVAVKDGHEAAETVLTRVHMRAMTPEEIRRYVATGEPMGKAGAYGIQGRAARFIDWIEGSWSNVVGLPVATVDQLLNKLASS